MLCDSCRRRPGHGTDDAREAEGIVLEDRKDDNGKGWSDWKVHININFSPTSCLT